MSKVSVEKKNPYLEKLYKDLKQIEYGLKKRNLYSGLLGKHIEALLDILKNDYEL